MGIRDPEVQLRELRAHCSARNRIAVKEYVDHGVSGTRVYPFLTTPGIRAGEELCNSAPFRTSFLVPSLAYAESACQ
jgi:hypothetical protein